MSTLVMKFGGTSVGSAEAMQQCVKIIADAQKTWPKIVAVSSAMSGVTDILLKAASRAVAGETGSTEQAAQELRIRHTETATELLTDPTIRRQVLTEIYALIDQFIILCNAVSVLGEATPRALDAIASLGERMSIRILAAALSTAGILSVPVESSKLIVTDENYQSANPDYSATKESTQAVLLPILDAGSIPVVTGFMGATRSGVITTLGRGGSDYTAAILAVALQADEVWIWTDVDGVMTTDPRIVKSARTIEALSFREISELAYFGAKVLHPKTIRPVIEAGIVLRVLNTFNPTQPGTRILADNVQNNNNNNIIKAVTLIKDLKLITLEGRGMLGVPGVAARTFRAIASTKTSVPLISQASSEQSICFAVPSNAAEQVIQAIKVEFEREFNRRDIDSVWATEEVVIISVVGSGMRRIPGVAGQVFSTMGKEKVNVMAIAQGSSEASISFIVDAQDGTRAVQALHPLIV
jgi:bifunctional aspartokinase / homoserine dehydrogenase 1